VWIQHGEQVGRVCVCSVFIDFIEHLTRRACNFASTFRPLPLASSCSLRNRRL